MCDASTILVVEIRAAWRILINETHDATRRREFFCEVNMMDLSIFLTAEAWISLGTLIFLEIVLGVDNIVFITITTDRLPKEKQALGRKLGLAGALISRIIFLSFSLYHLFCFLITKLFNIFLCNLYATGCIYSPESKVVYTLRYRDYFLDTFYHISSVFQLPVPEYCHR